MASKSIRKSTGSLSIHRKPAGSNSLINQEAIAKVVKSILIESDVIQESLSNKIPAPVKNSDLLNDLKLDTAFITEVSDKVSSIIMNNDTFRQIVCDSLSLEVNENMQKLEKEIEDEKVKTSTLESQLEELAQYSRRNCIVLHGLPLQTKETKEDTDQLVIDTIKNKMGIRFSKHDLDRSHRLPTPKQPIIVKFLSHNLKSLVYNSKKKLKGSNLLVTEALTPKRRDCLSKLASLRKEKKILSYWTMDGKIFFTKPDEPNKKIQLKNLNIETIVCE